MINGRAKFDTQNPQAVSYWLFIVAGFVVLIVLVGGLTRLMDAGLSITEWQPITGFIPPLTAGDWQMALAKYKTIPEYQQVNKGFSLAEFKVIYWWEWGHRFLGRLVGLVFFVPFIWFLARRQIPHGFKIPLWILFALGGLQGFVGWYMVQSGLTMRVDVSHYRLALHLGLALIIFSYAFWLALKILSLQLSSLKVLRQPEKPPASSGNRIFAALLVVLVFGQSLMGALVAGLKAGKTYTDWPFMDGDIFPAGLLDMSPIWRNFFDNHLTVQFDHRMGAYVLLILVFWHAYRAIKTGSIGAKTAIWLALGVSGQAVLGVLALLFAVPIALGAAHQFGAVLVLGLAVYHLHIVSVSPKT